MCDQAFNLKFVEEVEKHEVLYNHTLPGYSRRDMTEKAWQEVANEVNIPVAECKEKWRNLRTVFLRKMKHSTNASSGRRKKAYYLENAMQFCLPFLKGVASPILSNLPPITSQTSGDVPCNVEKANITFPLGEECNVSVMSPSIIIDSESQIDEPHAATMADISVAEYFQAKKAKLQSTQAETGNTPHHRIDRQQGIKMFLLSLLPELEDLSDSQIKIFKRRVFTVIDEIVDSGT